jgi:hypothetical protein
MLVKTGDAEILEVVKVDEESDKEKDKILAAALDKAKGTLKDKTKKQKGV